MPRCLGALAALCLLTACLPLDPVWVTTDAIPAPVPADPSESDSSTGALPTTSGEDSTVAAPTNTSDASTSSPADEVTGSTCADGGEDMGSGGGVLACWADECSDDAPCGKNLACLPHPINGAMVCVASDCSAGPCDGSPLACGEAAPQGVCIVNETKHGWCYPQVCRVVSDCAAGSTCSDGYCYPSSLLD